MLKGIIIKLLCSILILVSKFIREPRSWRFENYLHPIVNLRFLLGECLTVKNKVGDTNQHSMQSVIRTFLEKKHWRMERVYFQEIVLIMLTNLVLLSQKKPKAPKP